MAFDNSYLFRMGIPQQHSSVDEAIQERMRLAVEAEARRQMAEQERAYEAAVAEAIDTYLADLHASMWGRAFAIDSAGGRARATEFLLRTFKGVAEKMNA